MTIVTHFFYYSGSDQISINYQFTRLGNSDGGKGGGMVQIIVA